MNTYIIYMVCPFGDYDYMGNFDGDTEAEAIQAAIDFYVGNIDDDFKDDTRERIEEFYRGAEYKAEPYVEILEEE